VLTRSAFGVLAALCTFAWAGLSAPRRRPAFVALTGVLAYLMAVHLLHGFHAPQLAEGIHLTPDATGFSLGLNFDKGAAGLVLLAAFCARVTAWREFARQLPAIALATVLTVALCFGLALATGYVHYEPKWPATAPAFLVSNLFFTCVAEEAFTRGLIQERLMRLAEASGQRRWVWAAVAASALVFGLAHAGGGIVWTLLAMIAGCGYAGIYARTRTIEGSIIVHFAVNAVHFVAFTYPALAH
jgi:membrane protease YdiL (CAAX protease family)